MNIKTYLFGSLVLLLGYCTYGQELGFTINELSPASNRLQGKIIGKIYYINALENSSYLYPEEWTDGEIELSDGDTYKNMKLRYHAKADELIAYNEKSHSLYTVEKEQVSSFTIVENGKKRRFRKCYARGAHKKGRYLEELYMGTQWFLMGTYVYEQKVSPFTDNLGIMRDVEYHFRNDYFRYSNEEGYVKMGLRRSSVLASFPEHKKEIRKLLRKNRIASIDEAAMIHVFTLLDERGYLN